jgi:hypothetical protein
MKSHQGKSGELRIKPQSKKTPPEHGSKSRARAGLVRADGVKSGSGENQGLREAKRDFVEAAKCIGINEQRVFEARQIRDANPRLYKEVKTGRRSFTSALTEIKRAADPGR